MTRTEYNELRAIKAQLNRWIKSGTDLSYGTQLTIRTNASEEFKVKLHSFYSQLNFHPAAVRVDTKWFDDQERIVYIYGREWADNEGEIHSWTELYTYDERARFAAALHS